MSAEGDGLSYAIRLHHRAIQDMEEAEQRLAALPGAARATEWHAGLMTALSTLAAYPHRCPLAREDRLLKRGVRQLLYPQSPVGGAHHRILFTVQDDGQEAPFVFILHIRHGARQPMTRREARGIQPD